MEAVERLCASPIFARRKNSRSLIRYIVENHWDGVKPLQRDVGVEVFGKKPNWDPKDDGTVRMEMTRLRKAMKAYYEKDGQKERVVFELSGDGYWIEKINILEEPKPEVVTEESPREEPELTWEQRREIAIEASARAKEILRAKSDHEEEPSLLASTYVWCFLLPALVERRVFGTKRLENYLDRLGRSIFHAEKDAGFAAWLVFPTLFISAVWWLGLVPWYAIPMTTVVMYLVQKLL